METHQILLTLYEIILFLSDLLAYNGAFLRKSRVTVDALQFQNHSPIFMKISYIIPYSIYTQLNIIAVSLVD